MFCWHKTDAAGAAGAVSADKGSRGEWDYSCIFSAWQAS